MRNTVILGSLFALLGLGSAALASDQSGMYDSDTAQVTRQTSNDDRGNRRERYEHGKRYRDRHHESREHSRSSHQNNAAHDAHETLRASLTP